MTDYGRGSGSEPWHPEDPLFGDQGYRQPPQGDWDPYATGQQPQYPHGGRQAPPHQQQYAPQQYQEQYPQQAPYPEQYAPQQYQQQYPQQPQPQPQQQQQQYPQGQYESWDTSAGAPTAYGTGPGGPGDPYRGQQPGYYGQDGYPPPEPAYAQQAPEQARQVQQQVRTAPPRTDEWEAEPEDDSEHPFFAGAADEEDGEDDDPGSRGDRRGGGSKRGGKKKRRSGMACLVVLVILGGGVGAVGYFGYDFYQSHFGAPPDYSGEGTGDVQVEIPQGATLNEMGNILKQAGVVKSVDAFTAAAAKDPKGKSIQAGVYDLRKGMSAAAAVRMMTDPKAQNALIIPEGRRATAIFEAVDKKLGLKPGTTEADAKGADLGLPAWANGKVEGFLFPTKYSVGNATKPVDLLKQMVKQAEAEYTKDNLEDEAKKIGRTPYEILTVASLVQAEAQAREDFGKVSRVIYNRLDQKMALGFDSTINYAMGRSTLKTSNADTKFNSPYNTYLHKGLPPGPIDNPGHLAIDAALHPTDGNWLYFVTVKPGDTRFTASFAEHQKNVAEFNRNQKKG